MGFTNYIAGLSGGIDVPNPAGDYASKLAVTAPWRASQADPTGYVPQPHRPVHVDEQTGLDPRDYHAAIARYEADIDSGAIRFEGEQFATTYPGQAESDASFAAWVEGHVIYGDTRRDYSPEKFARKYDDSELDAQEFTT